MKSRTYLANLIVVFIVLFLTRPIRPQEAAAQEGPPVLAFYYAWFDQSTWSSGKVAGIPAEPYHSADPATIERQVIQAQEAGIDAFVQSWYGPQEANNQTETNFHTLLDIAATRSFKAAVDFETTGPFFGDAGAVTNGLSTLLTTHVQHPAYLRYQGKPVIFFWRQQRFSVDEWATIRNQVDPDHQTYWIAEGVDIAYQAVFDGHYLYSVAWAASPADQLTKWGDRVRVYSEENQVERLWVATAMPGYDDTRQPRDNAFAVPRRNGDYLRETWLGALASQPNMLVITSFNEWLEGTQIEPSQSYGTQYLDVTRELVTALRGSPPRVPNAAPAAQEDPSEGEETEHTPPEEPP
ncbi:MAG TPA: endo-1,3-alpha-glucanase family glycosylhydrolase, partial [Anaerolineae bacterium]